jgi:predicted TIM-barrel fold metal-dependent hydrolase
MDVMITLQPMNICMAAADLVWSRVFKEFPTLKVALSEGGTGWIPYFLDRLDRTYDMHHLWTGQDFGDKMPSDIFRDHILTCFIADPVGIALRDEIGIDNICWEQDYPHSDSSWPEAPEELNRMAQKYGVTDEELNKITHENAMRWYRFDPFSIRPKERCTVSALRAEAAGHDVAVRSMSDRHKERHVTSLTELAANVTA